MTERNDTRDQQGILVEKNDHPMKNTKKWSKPVVTELDVAKTFGFGSVGATDSDGTYTDKPPSS